MIKLDLEIFIQLTWKIILSCSAGSLSWSKSVNLGFNSPKNIFYKGLWHVQRYILNHVVLSMIIEITWLFELKIADVCCRDNSVNCQNSTRFYGRKTLKKKWVGLEIGHFNNFNNTFNIIWLSWLTTIS